LVRWIGYGFLETSLAVGSWTVDLDAVQGDERATSLTIGP
jgi:hypothetical protein